ncbi:Rnase H [Salmonella phage NR01]|uniref:ribonuclease H n=1 Tax=Salmonella phage NR01 TaxID=1647411 RepID=A0A162E9H3_9CAUD|nr:Rnase H [Salmonella phage NR01]AKN44359.1 putative ribonuclease H [Salmonella phage NR01]
MSTFHIYTDGACKGNPGLGAWGFVVYDPNDERLGSKSGFSSKTTNNEMELTAIVEVLRWATKNDKRPVIIYTDSAYCKNGMESWMWSWQKKGWKKGDGEAPLNLELWQEAFKLTQQYINFHNTNPTLIKVKGHSGIRGNEEVDALCNTVITEQELADM